MQVEYDPDFGMRRKLLEGIRDRLRPATDLPQIIETVRSLARFVFSADGIAFVLNDDGNCHYVEENAIGPLWKGQRFRLSDCISGWAMLNGQTAAIEDIYSDPRIPLDLYRHTFVTSLIMVPVTRAAPVAALGAYWRERQQLTPDLIAVAEELADQVAQAMHLPTAAEVLNGGNFQGV